MKRLSLLLVACLLLAGCSRDALVGMFQGRRSLVRMCYPTERLLREAQTKYTDHVPLTADDFRHLVMDDTVHYKIVVVYNYCCGPCQQAMRDVYAPMLHSLDTTRCRMLFVLDDCGSLPWNADYLSSYGIDTRYYLRDDDSLFLFPLDGKPSARQNWTNIANYTFQPRRAFTDCDGMPCTFVVSPDGRVKQQYCQFDNHGFLTAYDLRDMVMRDSLTVYGLDYDRIDTVRYQCDYNADLIEDYRSSLDTVSFRTYRPQRHCTPDGRCH